MTQHPLPHAPSSSLGPDISVYGDPLNPEFLASRDQSRKCPIQLLANCANLLLVTADLLPRLRPRALAAACPANFVDAQHDRMSDHKGTRLVFNVLPSASSLIADRGYDSAWFREELKAPGHRTLHPVFSAICIAAAVILGL